jgi:hypothetical protein
MSSRANVIVLVFLGFVTLCLLSCGLQSSRDSPRRAECASRLRELGIAFHNYHDTMRIFPTENGPASESIYWPILDFIEMSLVSKNKNANAGIRLYLCPSRRHPANAPGKRDYGYAASSATGSVGESIFDAAQPMTLTKISEANGTAHTLLLAHVWMDPKNYTGGDPTDLGWATKNNSRSISNTAKHDTDTTGSTAHLGGPEPNTMPCLFADGHTMYLPYSFGQWANLWAWDNRTPVNLPR